MKNYNASVNKQLTSKHDGVLEKKKNDTTAKYTTTNKQGTKKKKQLSALGILKDTLKLKSSKNAMKTASTKYTKSNSLTNYDTNNNTGKDIDSERKAKINKRLSTQRVTLFYHNDVRVMSYTPNIKHQATDKVNSSENNKLHNRDDTSFSSSISNNTVSMKPYSLVAHGPIEIYQIRTISNLPNEKPQTMNYLSLGRKGNIIHPILPKLKVTKSTGSTTYSIHFYNPERFWSVDFYLNQGTKDEDNEMKIVLTSFEEQISKICDFTIKTADDTLLPILMANTESAKDCLIINSSPSNNTKISYDEESEDDQLSYLLEDSSESDSSDVGSISHDILINNHSNVISSQCTLNPKNWIANNHVQEDIINDAFKKAFQQYSHIPINSQSTLLEKENTTQLKTKRYSSYNPLVSTFDIRNHYKENNKSLSNGRSSSFE
ncbi:hypothetical protein TPHA_0H02150 [Tetrapisispora phaffii CBS 4417]|uniref:Inheritance of peroxisomes protein 1 n=1 Tax=Tetrapisispora phaffii (strain ATCC 24235 / CBS 4417 / NBRC 1672 / NRRL Y-8282 / UCD 70-5) TaxID=1071381 RepID=G8BWG8_TETPH|nr:hypothetical protein TPHA_0H02150 [Tetrapisispora phaffii CBS 4417]CCE64419.1 hypothetical protein TPHA_0H02150 [Tetrapisispora phaffii CBS 4417]